MTATAIPTPDPQTFDEEARPFVEALSDRYAMRSLIGRGGMGVVYLARDRRLDRLVAIKTLPPALGKDRALRERFLRETRTAGAMSHANIVPIHAADEVDGHVYFVMSYIDGAPLSALRREKGRLAPAAVARYLRDVAAALSHAHERGIIHRDIKAENILIERASDRALVTDFGIARFAEATPLTVTGQLLGTPFYVSPEQVSGETVDARSDLYSLGVVGYFALTGRFPFEGDVASAVLVSHVTRQAPPIATVDRDTPPALAAIIDRCLLKDPRHRFASAAEMLVSLDAAIADLAAAPRPQLVSDTEAHAIWKRAAELEANTGIVPRPEPVLMERDARRDAERRRGVGVSDLRALANEAGIAPGYVDHVLKERGIIAGGVAPVKPPAPAADAGTASRGLFTGQPTQFAMTREVDGELPAHEIDGLINILRDATGSLGHAAASTRELAWQGGSIGSRMEVSVVPRDGRTTIRIEKSRVRARLAGTVVPLLTSAFVIGPMVGVLLVEGFGMIEEFGVLLAFAAGLTSLGFGVRRIGKWLHDRTRVRLDRLMDALEARTRKGIERGETATPTRLGRPTAGDKQP